MLCPTNAAAGRRFRTADAAPLHIKRGIAHARANGGRYSVDIHLAHDPSASEAYATSHLRRLEAMRRANAGPERLADGSWTIPDDYLAQARTYLQRQQRDRPVTLSILTRTPVAELASKEAPTWLDRELESGSSSAVRDAGFGREVRTALAARRQWLIEQQLATEERGTFRMRDGAIGALRKRELHGAMDDLADRLGKPFAPTRMGGRIEGIIARRVELESGSYAVVEGSRDFTLVPWRDVLERHIGKAASGMIRTDGISWQFGRGRGGPQIS